MGGLNGLNIRNLTNNDVLFFLTKVESFEQRYSVKIVKERLGVEVPTEFWLAIRGENDTTQNAFRQAIITGVTTGIYIGPDNKSVYMSLGSWSSASLTVYGNVYTLNPTLSDVDISTLTQLK